MWSERVGCHGKARWGSHTDEQHTRVGLISPSGWSGRSSPSVSTRCPSWRSSDVLVWEELCRRGEEVLEGLISIDMNLRKPHCYSRELRWWPHWPEKGMSRKRNLILTRDQYGTRSNISQKKNTGWYHISSKISDIKGPIKCSPIHSSTSASYE